MCSRCVRTVAREGSAGLRPALTLLAGVELWRGEKHRAVAGLRALVPLTGTELRGLAPHEVARTDELALLGELGVGF